MNKTYNSYPDENNLRNYTHREIERIDYTSACDPAQTIDHKNLYEQNIQLLPPKCKEVFVLRCNGYSNRDIAERLIITQKSVDQHIAKAIRFLNECFKEPFTYAILLIPLFQIF